MKKILFLTRDALFRTKVQHRLHMAGAMVVCLTQPAKVESYLESGEIGLMVLDGSWETNYDRRWLEIWLKHSGLKFILTGSDASAMPETVREPRRASCRVIDKTKLVRLALEVVQELAPEVLTEDGGAAEEGFERRRSPRTRKSLRVVLGEPARGDGAVMSRTVDISPEGARVISSVPLFPSAHIPLTIQIPFFTEWVALTSRVVWSRAMAGRDDFVSGLFFDRMSDVDRFTLTNYLARGHA